MLQTQTPNDSRPAKKQIRMNLETHNRKAKDLHLPGYRIFPSADRAVLCECVSCVTKVAMSRLGYLLFSLANGWVTLALGWG